MKYPLIFTVILALAGGGSSANSIKDLRPVDSSHSQSDQVEVKTDRFSGVTTVTLKPQLILDAQDHFITMSLVAKFGDKKIRNEVDQVAELLAEGALVRFESQSKVATDFGDQELHFIIDGQRLNIGESAGRVSGFSARDPRLKLDFKILKVFVNSLNTSQLKQVAGGSRVEMRLGKYEFVLSTKMLGTLREFNDVFAKLSPSGVKRGKRP